MFEFPLFIETAPPQLSVCSFIQTIMTNTRFHYLVLDQHTTIIANTFSPRKKRQWQRPYDTIMFLSFCKFRFLGMPEIRRILKFCLLRLCQWFRLHKIATICTFRSSFKTKAITLTGGELMWEKLFVRPLPRFYVIRNPSLSLLNSSEQRKI